MREQGIIDGFEFARAGEEASGTVSVAALARLRDQLHDDQGTVSYVVTGALSEGKPILRLAIDADLNLTCQRCLCGLPWRWQETARLLLVEREDELGGPSDEDELVDSVVGGPDMVVVDLVEDEILLALPIAPMHPPAHCPAAHVEKGTAPESAFAALAQLKDFSKD